MPPRIDEEEESKFNADMFTFKIDSNFAALQAIFARNMEGFQAAPIDPIYEQSFE